MVVSTPAEAEALPREGALALVLLRLRACVHVLIILCWYKPNHNLPAWCLMRCILNLTHMCWNTCHGTPQQPITWHVHAAQIMAESITSRHTALCTVITSQEQSFDTC